MSKTMMTPRQRVMAALRLEPVDKIPFTVYESKIPQCVTERVLRNRGLCIVKRVTSYSLIQEDVHVKSMRYRDEQGRMLVKTRYETPVGAVETLDRPAGFTTWHLEPMFKGPDDYKVIRFMIENTKVKPNYDMVKSLDLELGEDFVIRDNLPLEPMQHLIARYMNLEQFSYEWADRRDEVKSIFDAQVALARKIYPIVAQGPLEFANYGGNVVPTVVGVENFRKYYLPHYNEAADIMHEYGKRLGTHLDADNTIVMKDLAASKLDYIEAYDPGMSPPVDEACAVLKNRALWINWPSAWHVEKLQNIRSLTEKLIRQAASSNGFLIGITEDVPPERWQQNYVQIMDGIDACAKS